MALFEFELRFMSKFLTFISHLLSALLFSSFTWLNKLFYLFFNFLP